MRDQRSLFDAEPMGRGVRRTAVLSDGVYRYSLSRVWDDDARLCAWVMLNPSTADGTTDDPTIRRCMAFARSWGFGGIVIVNLFAYRETDSKLLESARARGVDLRGPDRDEHLRDAFALAETVVCAWGAHALATREEAASALSFVPRFCEIVCLGRVKSGAPRHPLYLAADTRREAYP